MCRARTLPILVLLTSVASLAAAGGDPPAVVGAWRIQATAEQGGTRSAVLYVEEKDGKLEGRWNTRTGSIDLHDVQYENGQVSCWWFMDIQDTVIRLHFTAKVSGDTLEGELREPHLVSKVQGKRIEVKSGAVEPGEPPAPPPAPDGAGPPRPRA